MVCLYFPVNTVILVDNVVVVVLGFCADILFITGDVLLR